MDSSEFFITETDSSPWGTSETTRLHTELLDQLVVGPSSTWSDIEVAKALAELTHDEYQKYGTSGSELDNAEARKLLTSMKAVLARIGMRNVEFGFRDFDSFRSYWIRKGASGGGGWQARRDLLAELFNPIHDRIEALVAGGSWPKVTEEALSTLEDPGAIRDHLERIERNLDDDPRLAVGSAKELVESTAKLVLKRSGVDYGKSDDLPSLVAKAHTALGINAKQVEDSAENAVGIRTLLGAVSRIGVGMAELRNQVGTGHGQAEVPTWVTPRHARLAVGSAHVWCQFVLETLEQRSS
ncbi:MAG: abortive infection family protein [Nocardioides sp.]|uniref:abortive infection family protein n=1 Tax=Nocardioides sp. TaxID=35761 RepID=UPI0039E6A79F